MANPCLAWPKELPRRWRAAQTRVQANETSECAAGWELPPTQSAFHCELRCEPLRQEGPTLPAGRCDREDRVLRLGDQEWFWSERALATNPRVFLAPFVCARWRAVETGFPSRTSPGRTRTRDVGSRSVHRYLPDPAIDLRCAPSHHGNRKRRDWHMRVVPARESGTRQSRRKLRVGPRSTRGSRVAGPGRGTP